MIMKKIYAGIGALLISSFVNLASANDIYITQVGDTLDLDIVQDGTGNTIGDGVTGVSLDGSNMTFAITQVGNTNIVNALIKGTSYTGAWVVNGSSNNIDFKCSSVTTGDCETVTATIAIDGDSTNLDLYIGENADADNTNVTLDIDGDGNILAMSLDGTDLTLNYSIDNSASGGGSSTLANTFTIDVNDGGLTGQNQTISLIGGNNTVDITQAGTAQNQTVNLNLQTSGSDIDISQND
jgi:hypothetical protein